MTEDKLRELYNKLAEDAYWRCVEAEDEDEDEADGDWREDDYYEGLDEDLNH